MASGIHYGICESTSTYSWDLSYGLYEFQPDLVGKLNVTLVRTQEIYDYGDPQIETDFGPVFCGIDDDLFFINSVSIQLRADETYFWRPKKNDVTKDGEIINYNAPCDDSDEARIVNNWRGSATVGGAGDGDVVSPQVLAALQSYSKVRFGVEFNNWEYHGRNLQQGTTQWRTSNLRFKCRVDALMNEQDLSSIQINIAQIQSTSRFMVRTSKVKLFPDQNETELDYSIIKAELLLKAGIT